MAITLDEYNKLVTAANNYNNNVKQKTSEFDNYKEKFNSFKEKYQVVDKYKDKWTTDGGKEHLEKMDSFFSNYEQELEGVNSALDAIKNSRIEVSKS